MKSTYLLHSLFLGLAIIATFIWAQDPTLASYNLQLTGALVLLYFAFRLIRTSNMSSNGSLPSTIILTVISILLVFSTGGIISPLFFILNFLLFALALLFEPIQAGTASIILVGIFVWGNYLNLNTQGLINLASLILMTPLAIVFSRTYLTNLESVGKIKILKEIIKQDEEDSLLWIGSTAKPSIASVLNSVSDLVIYFNSMGMNLPKGLIIKLKSIQSDLITLYSSTGSFEKSLKETSDNIED